MKIYGNNITPACTYCQMGTKINVTAQIACQKKGIVPDVYSCRHFIYDPTKRIPPRRAQLPSFDKSDFTL